MHILITHGRRKGEQQRTTCVFSKCNLHLRMVLFAFSDSTFVVVVGDVTEDQPNRGNNLRHFPCFLDQRRNFHSIGQKNDDDDAISYTFQSLRKRGNSPMNGGKNAYTHTIPVHGRSFVPVWHNRRTIFH